MNKKYIPILTLGVLQAVSLCILFSPLKETIYSNWTTNKEELLSVAQGDITGNGDYVKVLKFKTKEGLRVEFLKENEHGFREVVNNIKIPHPYNGFFEYRGHSIQLGMSDVNGDGMMEVLAPSFDNNLVAHLNVYYYDADRGLFEKALPGHF